MPGIPKLREGSREESHLEILPSSEGVLWTVSPSLPPVKQDPGYISIP